MTAGTERLVVCASGGGPERWRLPRSEFVERRWIWGGVKALHEMAFAATAAGADVELRGWLDRRLCDELAATVGVAPALPHEPRRPAPGDVIVLPEGHKDPLQYARVWLSDAQLVVAVLAPLGLFGWPFAAGWQCPSPLTVEAFEVNRRQDFRAIATMGIRVWCGSPVITELARASGVHASTIGRGIPTLPDPPARKTVDVAWLQDNRWARLARNTAAKLTCSVDAIGSVDHPEMMRRLGAARILAYPGRIEGEPRVTCEARSLGTVPVVVNGANPVARRLSEDNGVLAVERLDQMPSAISELLVDGERLDLLAARGIASARTEVAWGPYVARVAAALEALPEHDPAAGARDVIGELLGEQFAELDVELGRVGERHVELEVELGRVLERNVELEVELGRVRDRNVELEVELDKVRHRKDVAEALLRRRSVRYALGAADLVRRNGSRQRA